MCANTHDVCECGHEFWDHKPSPDMSISGGGWMCRFNKNQPDAPSHWKCESERFAGCDC